MCLWEKGFVAFLGNVRNICDSAKVENLQYKEWFPFNFSRFLFYSLGHFITQLIRSLFQIITK